MTECEVNGGAEKGLDGELTPAGKAPVPGNPQAVTSLTRSRTSLAARRVNAWNASSRRPQAASLTLDLLCECPRRPFLVSQTHPPQPAPPSGLSGPLRHGASVPASRLPAGASQAAHHSSDTRVPVLLFLSLSGTLRPLTAGLS